MKKTLLVAIDLEMNQPSGKIIQVGAAVGDSVSGQVFGTFSRVANPLETISPAITELTGITQEMVDAASLLPAVYADLLAWLSPFDKQRILNPVVWGGDDMKYLRGELGLAESARVHDDADESNGATAQEAGTGLRWVFGHRWLDAKTVFAAWALARGDNPRSGLKRSLQRLNMEFTGTAHDAGNDALNTFRIWYALGQRFQDRTI